MARAGREYDDRRSALLSALSENGIGGSASAGFNLWIPTLHEGEVARRLLARGWAVRTGEAFRVAGRGGSGLRITVSTLPPEQAPALAHAMGEALRPTTRSAPG